LGLLDRLGNFDAVKGSDAFFMIISANSKKMINAIFLGYDNMVYR